MSSRNEWKTIANEKELLEIREKVEASQDPRKFTKDEKVLLNECYHQITGREASKSCNGCASVFKIIRNWYAKYDKRTIEPVKIPLKILVNNIEISEQNIEDISIELESMKQSGIDTSKSVTVTLGNVDQFKPKNYKELKEEAKHLGIKLPRNVSKKELIELIKESAI